LPGNDIGSKAIRITGFSQELFCLLRIIGRKEFFRFWIFCPGTFEKKNDALQEAFP
jgi:hypothetical protein